MKVFNSAVLIGKELRLTTASEEVDAAERKKKTGTPGSIWSDYFAEVAGKQGEWIKPGKRLRAGVSAVLLTSDGVILNRFDSGHPTAPNKLSTPAGIWEGDFSLLDSALNELGEEVIIVDKKCGFWTYNGQLLAEHWVKEYASFHTMQTSDFKVKILPFEAKGTFEIYLNGEYQGNALLAYEPETGGIEILFVYKTIVHITNEMIVDGERFKEEWLHREVGVFTLEQLLKEEKKTTKVEAVEALLRNL